MAEVKKKNNHKNLSVPPLLHVHTEHAGQESCSPGYTEVYEQSCRAWDRSTFSKTV